MQILLPVHFRPGEDFWLSDSGLGFLRDFFLNVHKLHPSAHVLSDRQEVLEIARTTELTATHQAPGDDKGILPPGTFNAVHHARRNFDDSLAVLGFRHPDLARTLQTAIGDFKKSDKDFLIGLTRPEDHPCQLKRYLVLTETGLINLMDDADKGRRTTRPFPFDWSDVPGSSGDLYQRTPGEFCQSFLPLDQPDGKEPTWQRVAPDTARLLLPTPCDAHIWPSDYPHCRISVEPTEDGFTVHARFAEPARARIFLVHTFGGADSKQCSRKGESKHDGTVSLTLEDSNQAGFVYQIYEDSTFGEFDCPHAYEPRNAPWRIDGKGACRINGSDRLVHGRQAFPEVHILEANLLIMGRKPESVLPLPDSANIHFFDLGEKVLPAISSEVDMLRHMAHGGHHA